MRGRASIAAVTLAALVAAACSTQATDATAPDEITPPTAAGTPTAPRDAPPSTTADAAPPSTTSPAASATAAQEPTTPTTEAPPATGGTPTTATTGATHRVIDASIRTPDGRDRSYRLYVPASLPTGRDVPLLVALHGGTGSGRQFELSSGFNGIAESAGFIVAYPDGVGTGSDGTSLRAWNGGYCCGFAARSGVDDVGFIRLLIDEISRQHPIDPARTYAAGHSNGGIMSYRLACELSDRIVAIGLQAGSLGIDSCHPSRPVSVLHLHGTADRNHPIGGGTGPDSISGVDFRPALDSVQQLAAANGCSSPPARSIDDRNPDLEISSWAGCRGGAEVVLVSVEGASHAWMGGAWGRSSEPYPDLSASATIWAFLAAHPRSGQPRSAHPGS